MLGNRYVKVELQDASTGAVLPGYALADAIPMMGSYLAREASWAHGASLPVGKRVRVRFEGVQSKLFAFAFGHARMWYDDGDSLLPKYRCVLSLPAMALP